MKRKNKNAQRIVTREMVEESARRHNYWLAFEKLCERLGETKNFFRLVRRRDVEQPCACHRSNTGIPPSRS